MDDLGLGGLVHHIFRKFRKIQDAGRGGRGGTLLPGFVDNGSDLEGFCVLIDIHHVIVVLGHVLIDVVFRVVLVLVGRVDELELAPEKLVVGDGHGLVVDRDLFSHIQVFDNVPKLLGIAKAQGVEQQVGDLVGIVDGYCELIIFCRPGAVGYLVFLLHARGLDHLGEGGHAAGARVGHEGSHHAALLVQVLVGVDLREMVGRVDRVDHGRHRIDVLDHPDIVLVFVRVIIQIIHETLQVVVGDRVRKGGYVLLFTQVISFPFVLGVGLHGQNSAGQVSRLRIDGQRIAVHGLFLDLVDVVLKAGREGQDQGDADNADGSREGGQKCPPLLGHEVVETQAKGCRERHGGLSQVFVNGFRLLFNIEGIGVIGDLSVLETDDPVGVLLGKLRVVGDHDDEPVVRHFLE